MAKWQTGEPPKEVGKYLVTYYVPWANKSVTVYAERREFLTGNYYWSIPKWRTINEECVIAW